jgi:hypothetical protein
MLRKSLLFFLFILVTGWTLYLSIGLIDQKDAYSLSKLFGKEDGQLLIVNRSVDYRVAMDQFQTLDKNKELLAVLAPNLDANARLAISAKRKHFSIEKPSIWSRAEVVNLFEKSGLKLKTTHLNAFECDGYEVSYYRQTLYIHQPDLITTSVADWGVFDKKANASIIGFINDKVSIKDIYFVDGHKIEFITRTNENLKGNQVNDKEIFSSVLPRNISNYAFYEKDYAKNTVFKDEKSPIFEWMDKGFVLFKMKDEPVFLSDFLPGQNPLQVLADFLKVSPDNKDHCYFENLELLEGIFKNGEGLHVFIMNNYVVISQDENSCTEIITQNKLGNTLNTDQNALSSLFNELPALVSQRIVSTEEKYSKTVYKNRLFETHIQRAGNQQNDNSTSNRNALTINVDANIKDFFVFNGSGNVAVVTATNELIYYNGGNLQWVKNLGSKIVGQIGYLEQLQTLLVTCTNGIHLLDKSGNYSSGGVVNVSSAPTQQAVSFEWKNRMYFAYPDASGNINVYGTNGSQVYKFGTGMDNIASPFDIWVSQSKLFIGVRSDNLFKMFDLERQAEHRSFTIYKGSIGVIESNEIGIFCNGANGLSRFDQKGTEMAVQPPTSGKLFRSYQGCSSPLIASGRTDGVTLMDATGFTLGTIKRNFNNIEFASGVKLNDSYYIIAIDGIENNVYLHHSNGRMVSNDAYEGSVKAQLNLLEGELILTTIVDNYLIQYNVSEQKLN